MQKKTLVQEQTMLQFLKYFFVESTITFRIYLYLLVKSNELSNNKIVNQIVDWTKTKQMYGEIKNITFVGISMLGY